MTNAVPTVDHDDDEFWTGASQPSLDEVWGNEEDEIYVQLLTH